MRHIFRLPYSESVLCASPYLYPRLFSSISIAFWHDFPTVYFEFSRRFLVYSLWVSPKHLNLLVLNTLPVLSPLRLLYANQFALTFFHGEFFLGSRCIHYLLPYFSSIPPLHVALPACFRVCFSMPNLNRNFPVHKPYVSSSPRVCPSVAISSCLFSRALYPFPHGLLIIPWYIITKSMHVL